MRTNIKYKDKDIKDKSKNIIDLKYGVYLIQDVSNEGIGIMIKNHNGLSFIEKDNALGFNDHDYDTFFNHNKIIGEITSMDISNLKIQNEEYKE
jgi:hypothetical protein